MQRTFLYCLPILRIEEYHGNRSQVTFNGDGTWAKTNQRCELADLMIVTFRETAPVSIRLTFLQAKSERKHHSNVCGSKCLFNAKTHQWYLLSERPEIKGCCKDFRPPENLLSDAISPSVGSFGFFYKNNNNSDYEVYYSSADNLFPINESRFEVLHPFVAEIKIMYVAVIKIIIAVLKL